MSDCIEWSKSRDRDGYGNTWRDGKQYRAHRLVFLDCNGYLPEVVTHTCDNPPCVNPAHLEAGTWQSNMDDKFRRGRAVHVIGENHYGARLTEDQVHWIRASSLSPRVIADWAGVSERTVRGVRRRETWKHV